MKKNRYKLLLSMIMALVLTQQIQVNATESVCNNELSIINNELNVSNNDVSVSSNNILIETESSIVVDMDMQQAKRMPVEKVVYDNPLNPHKTTKSPAQITKQGNFYFIADTFHDQVIYSDNLYTPIQKWRVITSKVSGPHSVASDGKYYLIADTENHRVLIFEWDCGGFRLTQTFEEMGVRPHYIEYDSESDSFYVWSSQTCEMYILVKDNTGTLCIKEIRKIKELEGHYIRSFTIFGDYILFPSGTNKQVLITDKNSLQILGRFLVPGEIAGMAYIKPIGNYFYMTISSDENYDQNKATIIRTNNLEGLINGEYEDISSLFPGIKIPYYIDYMQGAYYMTNHGASNTVFRFYVHNDKIEIVNSIEY
ncbi:MAG: hypothetical protein IKY94_03050 [Lachnospiraceae bacterium]|nr:hypothetical protein [Lachnospiraceae bacterium]